ncbi:MAG: hypothetical protein ABJN26_24980 [Stappiaceae bacterium]
MENDYEPVEPTRAFWSVILVSYGVNALTVAMQLFVCAVQSSFNQPDPLQYLIIKLVGSIAGGLFFALLSTFLFYFAALNVAAGIAILLVAIFGRLPLSLYLCAFPICAALIVGQYSILPTYHFYTALPEEIEWYEADKYYYRSVTILTVSFFIQFLCGWWHVHRFELSTSTKITNVDSD